MPTIEIGWRGAARRPIATPTTSVAATALVCVSARRRTGRSTMYVYVIHTHTRLPHPSSQARTMQCNAMHARLTLFYASPHPTGSAKCLCPPRTDHALVREHQLVRVLIRFWAVHLVGRSHRPGGKCSYSDGWWSPGQVLSRALRRQRERWPWLRRRQQVAHANCHGQRDEAPDRDAAAV